jgi:glutathione S-transferase
MKLYGDLISPFVRTVLVTAHEVGLAGRVTRVDAKVDPAAANAELAKIAPLGKIPVLVTDHGHPLYDSRVIVEYLCHISGNKNLLPDEGVKRFRVLTLQALAMGLADSAVAFRYETAARPQGLQWQGWMERTKLRAAHVFDGLEAHWIACLEDTNAGSIATAVALSYIDFRLPDWSWRSGHPGLAAFHATFAGRDSMVQTQPG